MFRFQTRPLTRNMPMKSIYFLLLIVSLFGLQKEAYAEDKVALLFLTIKDLNHPKIWQGQISANIKQFSVYIHSKEIMENSFFKKYRIANIVPTSWGFHVRAWQELIREAIKDPDNKKFVFLSESCVPILPLRTIYEKLMKDDNSYMSFSKPWWPSDHGREVVELPLEHRWGNHEWVILNRDHAMLVALDDDVINKVAAHGSDAESYPSTLFSVHGCLNDSNIVRRITTYVNWEHNDGPHPYTFTEANDFTFNLMQEARNNDCFFARKFAPTFPTVNLLRFIWKDYIHTIQNGNL